MTASVSQCWLTTWTQINDNSCFVIGCIDTQNKLEVFQRLPSSSVMSVASVNSFSLRLIPHIKNKAAQNF